MLEKNELLPFLINKYGCTNGAEIGVRDGENAARLLQLTSMYLYGIDIQLWPSVQQLMSKYLNRFSFYHMTSAEASDHFCEEELDFIYIDANHRYPGISLDLKLWYPKLKLGGVFCGDDYCNCWNPTEGQYEVVRAVEEFIVDKNVELNISGIGVVSQAERIAYANKIGKLHEDNFTGRKRTEGVPVPQWWFIKKE